VAFLALALMFAGSASRAQDASDHARGLDSRERLAETTGHPELAAELSDEQVFVFHRALKDSASNGLIEDLDADAPTEALEADLDPRQIRHAMQALEQKARFLRQAERFQQRSDATGQEQFPANAERATEQAQTGHDEFMAGAQDQAGSGDPEAAAREHARAAARRLPRDRVRDEARDRARQEARSVAREASREMRDQARLASQERAKEGRRN
jgi:hypothetical protein